MDKGFGKRARWSPTVTIERSELTDKWLVMLHLHGRKRCISPHWQKQDAKAAAQAVRATFGRYSPRRLKDPQLYFKALMELKYKDDDQVLGVDNLRGGVEL